MVGKLADRDPPGFQARDERSEQVDPPGVGHDDLGMQLRERMWRPEPAERCERGPPLVEESCEAIGESASRGQRERVEIAADGVCLLAVLTRPQRRLSRSR